MYLYRQTYCVHPCVYIYIHHIGYVSHSSRIRSQRCELPTPSPRGHQGLGGRWRGEPGGASQRDGRMMPWCRDALAEHGQISKGWSADFTYMDVFFLITIESIGIWISIVSRYIKIWPTMDVFWYNDIYYILYHAWRVLQMFFSVLLGSKTTWCSADSATGWVWECYVPLKAERGIQKTPCVPKR